MMDNTTRLTLQTMLSKLLLAVRALRKPTPPSAHSSTRTVDPALLNRTCTATRTHAVTSTSPAKHVVTGLHWLLSFVSL